MLIGDIKPKWYLWLIPVVAVWVVLVWIEAALGLLPRTGPSADFSWLLSGPLSAAAAVFIVGVAARLWKHRGRRS